MYGVNPTWGAQTNEGRTHIATKGVVQSGLVLNLDAGVLSSYPGSGTTWTDLSGNGNTGTLTNMEIPSDYSSTNGGSLTFDGVNEYVVCTGSLTLTAATFIAWINRASVQGTNPGIIFSRSPTATGMNFRFDDLGYHWNDSSFTYNWASGLVIPQAWCMCAITVTSSLATGYLYQASGLTTATNSVSHSSTTMSSIRVAVDAFENRYYNGSVSQALIYNRALTAQEIQQNYLATKSRYFSNLPVASSIPGTIITTGLQLYLDAGVSSSYPGSGTTWTDLSGNGNNVTLFNSVGYNSANGGSLVFDGVNDYAQTTANVIGTGASLPHTMEMWVNFDTLVSYRWWLAVLGQYNNGSHHWIGTSATATAFGVWGGAQNAPNLLGTNRWLHIVSTFAGTSLINYVNTTASSPVTATGFNFSNSNFSIGLKLNYPGENYFDGKVSIARIYNRALTASEIQQNFNATKSRYFS